MLDTTVRSSITDGGGIEVAVHRFYATIFSA